MNEVKVQSAFVIAEEQKLTKKLALIKDLLEEFHKKEILYCHWKSNEHLGASMTGDTDLDILFHEAQKAELLQILKELGFKKFAAIPIRIYRDIEDYIGFDLPSGKIIHLHAHFKLTMGEPLLKSYQPDIATKILASRVFDKEHSIYRSSPSFELILLFFRGALKLRMRDLPSIYFKKQVHYPANMVREFSWLKQRCSNHDIEIHLQKLVKYPQVFYKYLLSDFTKLQTLKLAPLVRREFRKYRYLSPFSALMIRWYREAYLYFYHKASRKLKSPVVTKRVSSKGGLVVAIIGADGSGKSTVIFNLEKTFGKKIDVYKIYFGRGRAGGLSWPRKMLAAVKKRNQQGNATKEVKKSTDSQGRKVRASFRQNLLKCLEAVVVAREKQVKLKRMLVAKKKNMLVVCDRFPQNQLMGFNDGPVLFHLLEAKNLLIRYLAKLEAKMYRGFPGYSPDIVFKLVAATEVVQMRKPSLATAETIEAKVNGIKQMKFKPDTKVVTVDAAQPLDQVLSIIKKEIWTSY